MFDRLIFEGAFYDRLPPFLIHTSLIFSPVPFIPRSVGAVAQVEATKGVQLIYCPNDCRCAWALCWYYFS